MDHRINKYLVVADFSCHPKDATALSVELKYFRIPLVIHTVIYKLSNWVKL